MLAVHQSSEPAALPDPPPSLHPSLPPPSPSPTFTLQDLDEIEEKTGIRLHSCQRQFDNLKRVYKHVEDKEGRLFDNIKMAFKLDDRLAAVYARAVFICDNRLAVDKKALHYLKYEHFSACAQILMDNLTSWEEPEGDDLELHRRFLQELRDVKYGFNHIDEHRA